VYKIGNHTLTPLQMLSMDTYLRKEVSSHEPLINMHNYGKIPQKARQSEPVSILSMKKLPRASEGPTLSFSRGVSGSVPSQGQGCTPSPSPSLSHCRQHTNVGNGEDHDRGAGAGGSGSGGGSGMGWAQNTGAPPGSPLVSDIEPHPVPHVGSSPSGFRADGPSKPTAVKRPLAARVGVPDAADHHLVDLEIIRADKRTRFEEEEEEPCVMLDEDDARDARGSGDIITDILKGFGVAR